MIADGSICNGIAWSWLWMPLIQSSAAEAAAMVLCAFSSALADGLVALVPGSLSSGIASGLVAPIGDIDGGVRNIIGDPLAELVPMAATVGRLRWPAGLRAARARASSIACCLLVLIGLRAVTIPAMSGCGDENEPVGRRCGSSWITLGRRGTGVPAVEATCRIIGAAEGEAAGATMPPTKSIDPSSA